MVVWFLNYNGEIVFLLQKLRLDDNIYFMIESKNL